MHWPECYLSLSTRIFQNLEDVDLFIKKVFSPNGELVQTRTFENREKKKKWTPGYFSTLWVSILINRSFLGCFWFIGCFMPACSFSSTQQKVCYLMAICGVWGFYILLRLMLSIYKHANTTSQFLLPYFPVGINI